MCAAVVAEYGFLSFDKKEWNSALCGTASDVNVELDLFEALKWSNEMTLMDTYRFPPYYSYCISWAKLDMIWSP